MTIHQTGPTEALAILKRLVASLAYKPGWKFMILDMDRGQGCAGTTLAITTTQPDSWDHTKTVPLWHSMPVPAAAYNEQAWTRWLLEQILLVEKHEAMEFFKINGEAPFFPSHGPGWHPYDTREVITRDNAFAESAVWTGEASHATHLQP